SLGGRRYERGSELPVQSRIGSQVEGQFLAHLIEAVGNLFFADIEELSQPRAQGVSWLRRFERWSRRSFSQSLQGALEKVHESGLASPVYRGVVRQEAGR